MEIKNGAKESQVERMEKTWKTKYLGKGGRRAGRISGEELAKKIKTLHAKLNGIEPEEYLNCMDFDFAIGTLMPIPAVAKDLSKVTFRNDSWWTSDNGLSFVGFICGGENQEPLFMMVYWDGKSFRGYIPTSGNIWNTKLHCAFGAEEDSDYGPYGKLSHLVYDRKYKGLTELKLTHQCLIDLGYGENGRELKSDWKLIEEDINKNITVI